MINTDSIQVNRADNGWVVHYASPSEGEAAAQVVQVHTLVFPDIFQVCGWMKRELVSLTKDAS